MPALAIIPARALTDDRVTGPHIRALCGIGTFTARDGSGVWAKVATLAAAAGMAERTFQRKMRELEAWGYVRRIVRPGTTALVSVVLDDPAEVAGSANGGHPTPANGGHPTPANGGHPNDPYNDPKSNGTPLTPRKRGERAGEPEGFAEAWATYPSTRHQSRSQGADKWRATVRRGGDPAEMLAGVRRYAEYCAATATDPRFVKHFATFFGPHEHWRLPWEVPNAADDWDNIALPSEVA